MSDTVLRKIYLSLYLKCWYVRGSWRPNRTAIYWPPLLWPSALCLSRSPGLLNQRPGGPSARCWLSLPHLVTNGSGLQTTDFLSSPSYIIVQSPTQYLPITAIGMYHFCRPWNGIFDCHRVEITVMQFTGHSLPVHHSMTVPQDFTVSHFVSQALPRQWNMHFRRLWNGMFGQVEGQYTTLASLTVSYTSSSSYLFGLWDGK